MTIFKKHKLTQLLRAQAARRATAWLRTKYVLGGDGTKAHPGLDCSGMVWRAYWLTTGEYHSYPRTAAEWWENTTPIRVDQLEPGDLCFYYGKGARGSEPSHVAMYLGTGTNTHTGKLIHNAIVQATGELNSGKMEGVVVIGINDYARPTSYARVY